LMQPGVRAVPSRPSRRVAKFRRAADATAVRDKSLRG
jgi:hypothetical protein